LSESTPRGLSQLDLGGVLKNSHDIRAEALRVIKANTLVGEFFTRADVTYNGSGSAISADFYYDRQRADYKLAFPNDIGGSLVGKYFLLDSISGNGYYVWFRVSGSGTDPLIAGRTGIVIDIDTNDSDVIIAYAFKMTLDSYPEFNFSLGLSANFGILTYEEFGAVDSKDINSGVVFETINEGETVLVGSIELPYENGVKYIYNEYEKSFVIFAPLTVTLETSATTANVVNVAMVNANQEYSFAVPNNTKRFMVKLRENTVPLKIKYSSGGDYFILDSGSVYEEEQMVTNNVTLYFESEYNNRNVEIIYWS